jgi:hypothetical protein
MLNESMTSISDQLKPIDGSEVSAVDTQVKIGSSHKRKFSGQYKLKILNEFDTCSTVEERGALLRREGLYSSSIPSWRRQLGLNGEEKKGADKTRRLDHLLSENGQLKKKLAQAQAIIDLQKKVSELLGTYILPHESNGVK